MITENSTVRDLLSEASSIVCGGWTKGHYARKDYRSSITGVVSLNFPCSVLDKDASQFCIMGALHKSVNLEPGDIEGGDKEPWKPKLIGDAVYWISYGITKNFASLEGITSFNDHSQVTHGDVLKVMDNAIQLFDGNK